LRGALQASLSSATAKSEPAPANLHLLWETHKNSCDPGADRTTKWCSCVGVALLLEGMALSWQWTLGFHNDKKYFDASQMLWKNPTRENTATCVLTILKHHH